jgi:hypothetical protein
VHRHDFSKRAARHAGVVAADAFEKIEPARIGFRRRFDAHPADDFFRIGQEGENSGGRSRDLGLASHDQRFIH